MNEFFSSLTNLTKQIYQPNNLEVNSLQEEKQNSKYGAGTFVVSGKTVRFRVAHVTPTKIGQFVAFWEKNENNKNQPFSYKDAPDLLVITTFKDKDNFGQFIFPKEILLKNNILKSSRTKGKMAMRVYPIWDIPVSTQAKKTQKWQLPYFVDLSSENESLTRKLIDLYYY